MLNFIRNCLKRNVEGEMEKKRVTYTVTTEVTYNDPGDWKRKVRGMRKAIKTAIATEPSIRVLKIENKQE